MLKRIIQCLVFLSVLFSTILILKLPVMAQTYRYIPFAMLNINSYDQMEPYMQQIISTYGPNNPNSTNLTAILVQGPFPLTQSISDMNYCVNKACELAEKYDIPVYFSVDDCTNYEFVKNTAEINYSEDPDMVEWSNWSGYVPGQWFNWGNWLVCGNVPCFGSPEFQNFMTSRLQDGLLTSLNTWISRWDSIGKPYLFAGVAMGWETHIQDWTPGTVCAPDPNNSPVNQPWRGKDYVPTVSSCSSSNLDGSSDSSKAIDENYSTYWSSSVHNGPNNTEWNQVDLGRVYCDLVQIELTPSGSFFPVDFKLQYSIDGTNFTDIPGQTFTNYPAPAANKVQTFIFRDKINARYLRMTATKLSTDGNGNYYSRISEFNVIYTFAKVFTNRSSASASSYLNSSWTPANAMDEKDSTGWSSSSHTSSSATEWITVDMGAVYENISRVRMTSRECCFPVDFKFQYSVDGITYADVPYQNYTSYPQPQAGSVQYFEFNQFVKARYVRLYATKLSADSLNNWCCQVMEIKPETAQRYVPNPTTTVNASSTLNSDWIPANSIDGDSDTGWSSAAHSSGAYTEWITLDLGSVCSNVARVSLTTRGCGFPSNFKFQYSTDGTDFTDIPIDTPLAYPFVDYLQPVANSVQIFNFKSLVNARYIRLYATKLTSDRINNWLCQVMEMSADSVVSFNTDIYTTTSASSYLNSSWQIGYASDLNNNTGWSSAAHTTSSATEWLTLDLGNVYSDIGRVRLIPRECCFPVDFKLQVSTDGTNFTDIPGQSYTNYQQPLPAVDQIFTFSQPVTGRYLRLYVTKLRADSYNNFYSQIIEFKAERGRVMQPEEFAQTGYHSLSYLGYTEASLSAEALSRGISVQQLTKEKLWQVQHDFTQLLAQTCYNAGISKNKIFTHTVGWDSAQEWNSTFFPPIWVAVNPYSIPGFTMNKNLVPYNMANLKAKIKAQDASQNYIAVTEGYCAGLNSEADMDKYLYEVFDNGSLMNTAFAYCTEPVWSMYYVPKDPAHPYNKSTKKWLNYNAVNRSTVTASSFLNSTWKVSNAADYDTNTGWSSAAHTGQNYTEWITLDMGSVIKNIGRVRITSRECCFPVDFKFQYSTDGINFTDIPGQQYYGYSQPNLYDERYFPFQTPVDARYIRLLATKLRADSLGNYYSQLMEFNADIELGYNVLPSSLASASSYLNSSWTPFNAVDGDCNTGWSSASHSGPNYTEWFILDMGATYNNIGRVKLTSRECCFPVDFKFQYSTDGTNFTDVPGQSYMGFAQPPKNAVMTFEFVTPVKARYVRLYATKLNVDSLNNWCAQLMEFKAYKVAPKYPIRASSYLNSDWVEDNAADGDLTTGWSSILHNGEAFTEWIDLNLKNSYTSSRIINSITLLSSDTGFPVDFRFQYSTDGINFTDIPGQSYTNYALPATYETLTFNFNAPVTAQYIRLVATKLRADSSNNYYSRILEFDAN